MNSNGNNTFYVFLVDIHVRFSLNFSHGTLNEKYVCIYIYSVFCTIVMLYRVHYIV